jgi:hypothetical protein
VNKSSELIDARDHAYLEMATAKTIGERSHWRAEVARLQVEIAAIERHEAELAAPDSDDDGQVEV